MAQQADWRAVQKEDELKVGTRVIVDKDKKGQIMWAGEDKLLGVGRWYGVRLADKRGNMGGTWKDKKFFWCPHGYGMMMQKNRIKGIYLNEEYDFMDEKEPNKEDPMMQQIQENRKRLADLRAKFRSMDHDGNKLVDVEEFGKIIAGMFPKLKKAEVKKLFQEVDVSNSGNISFAEFDAWVKKLGGLHILEHKDFMDIRQKFVAMDKDGNAMISKDEFMQVFCELFPSIPSKNAESLFSEIDTSGDGQIQFSEFDKWTKSQK